MSDQNSIGSPSEGGVRFPFINLEKAIGRAKELFDADQKGREMTSAGAFATWGYSEKSSGGFQTIAALRMYGLLLGSGAGKLQLTPEAMKYFRDEREDEQRRLRQYFAHRPKLIQALWQEWGASPPADTVARSHLKAERGLTDQGARSLLAIYKENIAFADFKPSDKVQEERPDIGSVRAESDKSQVPSNAPKSGAPWIQAAKAASPGKVSLMDGERIAFTEEGQPGQYLKLIASGDVDDTMLEALEDFVKRQRKRLKAAARKEECPRCGSADIRSAVEVNEETGEEAMVRECTNCNAQMSRVRTQ